MQAHLVDLHWYGPYSWFAQDAAAVFHAPEASRPGIYLWTVPREDGYLVHYVGETGKSFSERLTAHAKEYLSGVYRIYDPEKFALGQKELIWQGTWRPGTRHLFPEFMKRFVELAPLLQAFLLKMQLFLGPLEIDDRTRKRIEGAIARATANSFQETEIRYARLTAQEAPITVRMNCPVRILALPSVITA